jgi:cobalt-zinc-cadmium efflux system protein
VIAAVILFEAYGRFQSPPEVNSRLMMIIAVIGLAANIFVTLWLRREQKRNINIRSVFWHSMGDALASLGVIVGGLIITFSGKFWVDPLVSVLISLIILFAAWSILRDGLNVILEATPSNLDLMDMIETLKKIPGVKDVHDIHVWSISPELHAMNGHILIEDVLTSHAEEIRGEVEKVIREQYGITHTTLQTECQSCESQDTFCNLAETDSTSAGKPAK